MKKFISNAIVAIFLSLSLYHCATASAGMATSNIPTGGRKYTVLGPVEKEITWYTIDFGFLAFPFEHPPIDEIMNQAIDEMDADALINIRLWTESYPILFVTVNHIGLKAEAIRFE